MQVRAATQADMPDVERLCWDYRALLMTRTAHVPEIVETYYAQASYAALLADLPRIHARPTGDILVVDQSGTITGCAMYYPVAPATCEIKRVFLAPEARGTGAAALIVQDAMHRAKADGYARMVLDTIHTLTEAIALYKRLGFAPCAPFYDPDPRFAETLCFFDISLTSDVI